MSRPDPAEATPPNPEPTAAKPTTPRLTTPQPTTSQPTGSPAAGPRTVTLTKALPSVSLTKQSADSGTAVVNLNWSPAGTTSGPGQTPAAGGGFLRRLRDAFRAATAPGIDLDLGCMAVYADGRKKVVQALGNSFGALDAFPYIALDQDDRTGASSDGETLRINLEHQAEFAKLLIFVYIYEGAGDFRGLNAVATLRTQHGDRFQVHLDDSPPGARACAIALLKRSRDELVVQREVRWFTPKSGQGIQETVSRAYRLGFKWTPGRK
ncbi:hypothetical protein ACIQGZ_18530 [Streptomyces sp. NPDC092296]|uniref:hypothetical protein n=1 Tax=Streptomyces sp. NPDC092296 TaxID=3366012 RepID=UPI0038098487